MQVAKWIFRILPAAVLGLWIGGCQTPERKAVRQRLDRIMAENSEVKAHTESQLAQQQIESARQRQDDLKLLESVNAQMLKLNQQMDEMRQQLERAEAKRAQSPAAVPAPAPEVAPKDPEKKEPPTPAETAAKNEELERARAEAKARIAKMEEQLAKAQAQAESAKLAVLATEKSDAQAKADAELKTKAFPITQFVDASGGLVDLSAYKGKPVVLSVMKGFYSQGVCVYCTRQTSDLADNINAFKELGCEVLVVYPGREEHINTFVRSVREHEKSDDPRFKLPFKVLLDVNLDAVRALNIVGDLAHPTTFVLDADGIVRYQYVGRSMSDRPSVKEVLEQVRKVGARAK
jgi:peroxiredoxin